VLNIFSLEKCHRSFMHAGGRWIAVLIKATDHEGSADFGALSGLVSAPSHSQEAVPHR